MIVNMHEAKTRLSALVAQAEAGEIVEIARNGTVVARIVPVSAPSVRFGLRPELAPADDWDSEDTNARIAQDFDVRS